MANLFETVTAPFKTLREALAELVETRDAIKFGEIQTRLYAQITAAYDAAFEIKQREAALMEENSTLKRQLAELETWETESKRYERRDVGNGIIAFVLKQTEQRSEAPHMLCAKCYHDRKTSELQPTEKLEMRRRVWFCPRCTSEFVIGAQKPPSPAGRAVTEYDIFNP